MRKHGHGAPWRFPFEVLEVKPHAVRLKVPTDGSVPGVTSWQSLRKCAFAAPAMHDGDLPRPTVDLCGRVLVHGDEGSSPLDPDSESESESPGTSAVHGDAPSRPPAPRYQIDSIIRAEKRGSGWTVYVKWEGPEEVVTPEPLSEILRDIQGHAGLLREIEECKKRHLLEHPEPVRVEPEVVAPTRIQPARSTRAQASGSMLLLSSSLESLCALHRDRAHAVSMMHVDMMP